MRLIHSGLDAGLGLVLSVESVDDADDGALVASDYHLSHALIICDGFQFQPSLYCFTEFVDFRTRSVN